MKFTRFFCSVVIISAFGMGCSKPAPSPRPASDSQVEAPSTPSPALTSDTDLEVKLAILQTNGGVVNVTHDQTMQLGQDGASLFAGDTVEVASGTAEIVFPEAGASALPAGSKVTLVAHGSGQGSVYARVMLEAGSIWTRFERLLGPDEHFSVSGNGVVATVRGTAFGMLLDGKGADVQVAEHVVDVATFDDDGSSAKKAIDVTEGRGLKIDADTLKREDHEKMQKRIRMMKQDEKGSFGYRFMKTKLPDSIMRPGKRKPVTTSQNVEVVVRVVTPSTQPIPGVLVKLFTSAQGAEQDLNTMLADELLHAGVHDAVATTYVDGSTSFRLRASQKLFYRVRRPASVGKQAIVRTGSWNIVAAEEVTIVLDDVPVTPPPIVPFITPPTVPSPTSTPPIPPESKLPAPAPKFLPTKLIVSALGPTSLTTGQSSPLEAKVEYSDGTIHYVTPQCVWSSSNPELGGIQNGKFVSLSGVGSANAICKYAESGLLFSEYVTFTISLDPQLHPVGGTGALPVRK